MKFCLFVLAFIALVPQAAWSACNLSATTPSEVDTGRKLVNADTAAITQAAIRNHDITGCDVSGITDMEGDFIFIQTLSIKTSVVGMCRTSQI